MHRYIIHYCVTYHLDRELDCIHVDHVYCTHTHSCSNIIMVFEAQRPNDTSHIWSACVLVCLAVIGWKFWLIENDRDHLCIGFVTWSFVTRAMGKFKISIENDRFLLKRYTYEKTWYKYVCVYSQDADWGQPFIRSGCLGVLSFLVMSYTCPLCSAAQGVWLGAIPESRVLSPCSLDKVLTVMP